MKVPLKIGKRAKRFERKVTESSQTAKRTTGEIQQGSGIYKGRTRL